MRIAQCPECNTRVVPKSNGKCPACQAIIAPYVASHPEDVPPSCPERQERAQASTWTAVQHPTSIWPTVAAVYALIIAVPTILGVPYSLALDYEHYGNAARMPIVAAIVAMVVGISAVGLMRRRAWARHLFLITAPWASIAIGSVFAPALWWNDVPDSAILVFAYVPIAFLLSRRSALESLGITNTRWVSRGGALVAVCVVTMLIARFAVASSGPPFPFSDGSGGLVGAYWHGEAVNAYVQRLVLCEVPLWNYAAAFVAVSIPARNKLD